MAQDSWLSWILIALAFDDGASKEVFFMSALKINPHRSIRPEKGRQADWAQDSWLPGFLRFDTNIEN
ncbi:MAG: hypothetical protein IIC61_07135 [Proteobacteria bacterium]|nr:hypothetical protein [Pseudomonadota bacterium]